MMEKANLLILGVIALVMMLAVIGMQQYNIQIIGSSSSASSGIPDNAFVFDISRQTDDTVVLDVTNETGDTYEFSLA